jgi:membrane fusion protein (multidrug efflux system)
LENLKKTGGHMKIRYAFPVCFVLLTVCGCDNRTAGPPRAAPVKVAAVEAANAKAAVEYTFSGTLAAKEEVGVRSRINGYLSRRAFQEGAYVLEGDVLYQLDDRNLKSALDMAKADTAKAEAAYKNDVIYRDRLIPLVKSGAAGVQDLDNAAAKVDEAQAQLQAARANEEKASVNLGYATITAPLTGYISRSSVDTGGYVTAGDTLLTTMYRIDPIRAEFSITDRELVAFRQVMAENGGDPKSVVFRIELGDARTPYGYTGVLEMADPVVDSRTNTLGVRAEFPNPEHVLRPGLYVNVIASLGEREVLTVPEIALLDQGNGKAVYVVGDGNKLVVTPVETGQRVGNNRIVLKGLAAGQKVVTEGLVTARPGLAVEIIDK